MKIDNSGNLDQYSSLRPVYSLNILGYNHFTEGGDKDAPEYIRKAAGIIEYSNMDEGEKAMIDAMEKAQADYDAYLVTAFYEF